MPLVISTHVAISCLRISWDVNTWAWMEVRRNFRLRWYKAGYSDSILNLPT